MRDTAHTANDLLLADLYIDSQARLRKYAARWLQDSTEADDVVHDVFLSAFAATHASGSERVTYAYVFTSLRRACARRFRKQRISQTLEERLIERLQIRAGLVSFADCESSDVDLGPWLRQTISTLSPQSRICLQLYLEGYSYKEMASSLHITRDTVDAHLQRAKKRLRQHAERERERERERE